MKKYLKSLGYYLLTIVDGLINFGCSIFGTYPTVDISTSFLLLLEMKNIQNVREERIQKRQDLDRQASEKFEEAQDGLDG